LAAVATMAVCLTGCTSFHDYVHNGFKVGPSYCTPPAEVAKQWVDAGDPRIRTNPEDLAHWWRVFNDPVLNRLVDCAYQRNLTVKQAGFLILEARYQLAIAKGDLFPQTQTLNGSYARVASTSLNPLSPAVTPPIFLDRWNVNFNLQWQLDFWGQFRRAVQAQEAFLEAQVANYDAALVTMFGEVAQYYLQIRTDQEAIRSLRENVKIQKELVLYTKRRFDAGFRETELALSQARAIEESTEAQIPPLEQDIRQKSNALCVLMGMPPANLSSLIGNGPIPTVPPDIALGIPCDLLRRVPTVRQAERLAAQQAEQIGIAQAAIYPAIFINGTMGYTALNFPQLFSSNAFNGSAGPSFQWNVLNYGRLANNVKLQDATLQQLIAAYQQSVLVANQAVEDGLATFFHAHDQTELLRASVRDYQDALRIVLAQEKVGAVDYSAYATIATALVTQEDLLASAQGQITQGLVQVYQALGGGWQIRCQPEAQPQAEAAVAPAGEKSELKMIEEVPAPSPKQPDATEVKPKPPVAEPNTLPPALTKPEETSRVIIPEPPIADKSSHADSAA
jgi:NodT family efflux transporter outer membrane factor (OMF) lipoprotein